MQQNMCEMPLIIWDALECRTLSQMFSNWQDGENV